MLGFVKKELCLTIHEKYYLSDYEICDFKCDYFDSYVVKIFKTKFMVLYEPSIINCIKNNHLKVLKWFIQNKKYQYNEIYAIWALYYCNLKMLKYLCRTFLNFECSKSIVYYASISNNIEILKWIDTHYKIKIYKDIIKILFKIKCYEIFKWYLNNKKVKKIMKCIYPNKNIVFNKFMKTIMYKKKKKYFKGLKKN